MEKEIVEPHEVPCFYARESCMVGLAEFRDIPCCEYPWLKDKHEKKANEYNGLDYDEVLGKLWSAKPQLSGRRGRGGRKSQNAADPRHGESQHYMTPTSVTILGETMDLLNPLCTKKDFFRVRAGMHNVKESCTSQDDLFKSEAKQQQYTATTSATILEEKMDLLKPLCTKEDFFRVRVRMHNAKDSHTSQEDLFKSEAKQEELCIHLNPNSSYFYHAISNGLSATSYAHFFHTPAYLPFNYVQPTTLEGDIQYISFFRKLVELARYRDTRDMVLAKAIAIASSAFRKMRFFQIEIAVDDCLKLMDHGETMWQRQELYYYIVHEIVFKKREPNDVIKHIQEGQVQLFYDLTEFDCQYIEDAKETVLETVHCSL